MSIAAQLGDLPSLTNSIDAEVKQNSTTISLTIYSPYDRNGRSLYVGIFNNHSMSVSVSVNPILIVCPTSQLFGATCDQSLYSYLSIDWIGLDWID